MFPSRERKELTEMVTRRTVLKAGAAAPALLAATRFSPGLAQDAAVRVGSKDFPESIIIGEMYALLLENAGLSVDRLLNLGGTVIAHESLINDELDIYPEYSGTGLLVVLGSSVDDAMAAGSGEGTPEAMSPSEAVFNYVRDQYQEQFDLVWLDPTPMSNSQALAVRREFADEHDLSTITDLVALASSVDLVFSAPVDFEEREDGLLGLRSAYGEFDASVNGVAPGIKYQALMDGDANVVLAFSTDAEIAFNDLVVLEDDAALWPPYNVSPVVRQSALDANPAIADTLNALAPLITDEVMIELNGQVVGEDQLDPEVVAREFLIAEGLIAAG
jgi:osmoprotectant transport system substrate-binding protein